MAAFSIEGNIVNIKARKIFFGRLDIRNGKISKITETGPEEKNACYIMPGFIDSHVHIESSMLVPSEFAKIGRAHV